MRLKAAFILVRVIPYKEEVPCLAARVNRLLSA
jgi:hypothetical protein